MTDTNTKNESVESLLAELASVRALLETAKAAGKSFEDENLRLKSKVEKLEKAIADAQIPDTFMGKLKHNWKYILGGVGIGAAAGAGGMYLYNQGTNEDTGSSEMG